MADITAPQAPTVDNESNIIIIPSGIEMLRVGVLGALVGVFNSLLAWVLQRFLIEPIFCHGAGSSGICAASDLTAYYVSTIVISVIAVALLANWQVFRPLLLAVAAAASLWGLRRYVGEVATHNGWEYYLGSALLYAAAYLVFYWLLRLRSFVLSVILTVAVVVVVRWALLA